MANDQALVELIHSSRLNNHDKRTFSLEFEGKKIWVKQCESASLNIWHRLSGMIAKMIHSPLFVPTVATDAQSSLEGEARRLKEYLKQGISVPEVKAQGEGWLALADGGKPLNAVVRDPKIDKATKQNAMMQAVHTIVKLHHQNLWHGRPALRDIAYDGNQVTLIDFEEDPGSILSPNECMVRDVFLFVHSLFYYLRDEPEILQDALKEFQGMERPDIWEETIRLSKRMIWIYWILKVIEPIAGKDARFAYRTLKFFLER